jgi:pimeloyl-ACP methyl ester carboxylesterase
VNEVNVSYKVHGEGEPLVLIMGFAAPRWAWFFQTRAFRKYYKVITFDNRGVGKTDKPSEPYTIKTMADDTIGLMDYLGIDKAHILGYSMGGIIAQELIIHYPERVRKLILSSTLATIHQITSEMREALSLGEDFSFSEKDIRSVDIRKALSSLVDLGFNRRLYRMILVPIASIYIRLVGLKGPMGQIEAIAGCNTLERLHTIQAPTLVIVGTGDKAALPRFSEVLASRIPDAKLVKVKGGSHGYIWEMPGRFNKEVLDFLRGN